VFQVTAGPDKSAKMISKNGKMQPDPALPLFDVGEAINPLLKLVYVERQTSDPNGIRTVLPAVKGRI
jgi:hypothetical protein